MESRISQIFRSSSGITFLSLLSTIFGFITQIILAAIFGTAKEMDAYLVSITIPAMVISIFSGSLNYTFIPVFVENKTKGLHAEAWETVNNLFNLSFIVFLALALLGIIYSVRIVNIIAPGLSEVTKSIACSLFKIQIPMIAFSGVSAILSGIYYAEKKFLYPSIANLINSAILFIIVYLFSGTLGIRAVAWGGIIGSCAAFFMLLPALLKVPKYKFTFTLKEQGTQRILRLIIPLLFGAIFYRADNLIQRYIASSLTTGSISYLGYAFKLVSTASSLIVSGISIVLLQHVSELSSQNNVKEIGHTFSSAFKWLTFFIMPIIIIMVIVGRDLINILFQRGRFDELATYSTWLCLMLYSGVFYGGIIGSITTPIFYAYKNTNIVVTIGIAGALLQAFLSYFLAKSFSYSGLPIAYSISNLITIFIFLITLNKKYVTIPLKEMLTMLILVCSAGIVVTLMLWQVKTFLLLNVSPYLRFTIMVPVIGIFYLGICSLLKINEAIKFEKFIYSLKHQFKIVKIFKQKT